MRTTIIAAALAIGGMAAQPTLATEWIYCNDATNTVTVGLLLGHIDVLNISAIILSNGDRVWASSAAYGPGEEVGMGQGYADDKMMAVDLMDKDYAKLAELRLLKASEGDMYVTSGTLRMPGQGAWAVICEGP
jgi:hypothetical protein